MSSAKHAPATPLPWKSEDDGRFLLVFHGEQKPVGAFFPVLDYNEAIHPDSRADYEYIAHAANAYPKLVAALDLAYAKLDDKGAREEIGALLHELGEAL